jgi:hypothetical protein
MSTARSRTHNSGAILLQMQLKTQSPIRKKSHFLFRTSFVLFCFFFPPPPYKKIVCGIEDRDLSWTGINPIRADAAATTKKNCLLRV